MPKHDIDDEAGSEGDDYVSDNVASDGEAEAAKPVKQKKKRAKQEKAPKDPNAPKRPQSTYFLFLAEKRAQFKLDNPDAKSKEIVSQIAAMWNAPGLDKTPYEEQYKTDKAAYEIVKAEYEAKHGKPVSAKASKQKKGPKRPPSAYLMYVQAMRAPAPVPAPTPGARERAGCRRGSAHCQATARTAAVDGRGPWHAATHGRPRQALRCKTRP